MGEIQAAAPISAQEVQEIVDQLKSWEQLVQERAMKYVIASRKEFKRRINQAAGLMPKNTNEHRVTFMNHWFDALVGNVVTTIAEYGAPSIQTEEAVVNEIKRKFAALRALTMGAEGEKVEVNNESKAEEQAPVGN